MTADAAFGLRSRSWAVPDLLMIGADRMFYSGRLKRRLAPRHMGALSIYAAPAAPFEISLDAGPPRATRLCAVPAHLPHRIAPPEGALWNICIEPDSIAPAALEALVRDLNAPADGGEARLARLRLADARVRRAGAAAAGFTTADFDRLVLGAVLPARDVDPRIAPVLAALRAADPDDTLSAADCAAITGLSVSRFLHLFKAETGVPFRSARMWHRARRFLERAPGAASLTGIAMDLGYPDAAHFSRSIHRTFGMQPRTLRQGARLLRLLPGADYRLAGG